MSTDANDWLSQVLQVVRDLRPPRQYEWALPAHPGSISLRLVVKAQEEHDGGQTWWVRLIRYDNFQPIKGQHCTDMPMLVMVVRSYLKDAGIT